MDDRGAILAMINMLRQGVGGGAQLFNHLRVQVITEEALGKDEWTTEQSEMFNIVRDNLERLGVSVSLAEVKVTVEDLLSMEQL